MTAEEARYWDAVAAVWQKTRPQVGWRLHCDAVNRALLARWLPADRVGRLLKTDTFDEAGRDGLYPLMASRAERVVGLDISLRTLRAGRASHSGLRATAGDVRRLPFADGAFDVVVSNSTLDHFGSLDELIAGLEEIHRVLRDGGQLLLTLDNLANPIVALRNALPYPVVHRAGIVPYYVGASCGPRRLRRVLSDLGYDVAEITAILHSPRVLAVALGEALDRHAGPETQRRFSGWLLAFERLARWPTRFLTGHFVAVRAVRRDARRAVR